MLKFLKLCKKNKVNSNNSEIFSVLRICIYVYR